MSRKRYTVVELYALNIALSLINDRDSVVRDVYMKSKDYNAAADILGIADNHNCSVHTARTALEFAIKGFRGGLLFKAFDGLLSPEECVRIELENLRRNRGFGLSLECNDNSNHNRFRDYFVWTTPMINYIISASKSPIFTYSSRIDNGSIAMAFNNRFFDGQPVVDASKVGRAIRRYRSENQ